AWSNGATATTIFGLGSADYTITITDRFGCAGEATIFMAEPDSLAVATTTTDIDCNGASTGTADLQRSGGTPPYQQTWSDGDTSAVRLAMAAGSYTVTVTDANNCATTQTVTLSESPALVLNASSTPDTVGSNSGSAAVHVQGGVPPYAFLWDDPQQQSDSVANGLAAGNYLVQVTDALSCTDSLTVTVGAFTSVGQLEQSEAWQLYPNPTAGNLQLALPARVAQPVSISVKDLAGRLLHPAIHWQNSHRASLDLRTPGVYLISITTPEQAFVPRRVVVTGTP
ncbi:MAG: T9SS type A sorting domain-containing protein, partial [Bacteroidota bacterium]